MKKKESVNSSWTPTTGMLTGWLKASRRVAMLLLTTLLLTMTAQTTWAETVAEVKYLDENGNERTCAEATVLTGNESSIGVDDKETWYIIAQDELTYSNVLRIYGNCHLILAGGAALNLSNQISYASPTSLTIYAQSTGEAMGALTVATSDIAVETDGGNLTINGGRISITSTERDGITPRMATTPPALSPSTAAM